MALVKIGTDTQTSELLYIDDIERRSGLYILSNPGMGKTALLINLILQDITHGHGVFFLNPHGDAIQDILVKLPQFRRTSDIILLDPTHKTHTFGINPLHCSDINNINDINTTYARAYGIFERIWPDDFGPWLPLILSNTLSASIENQGYTSADVPLFLKDKASGLFFLRMCVTIRLLQDIDKQHLLPIRKDTNKQKCMQRLPGYIYSSPVIMCVGSSDNPKQPSISARLCGTKKFSCWIFLHTLRRMISAS